jgi:uncharacterized membrane protein
LWNFTEFCRNVIFKKWFCFFWFSNLINGWGIQIRIRHPTLLGSVRLQVWLRTKITLCALPEMVLFYRAILMLIIAILVILYTIHLKSSVVRHYLALFFVFVLFIYYYLFIYFRKWCCNFHSCILHDFV